MKLILRKYGHSVVMHMEFCQDIFLSTRWDIAFWLLKFMNLFRPQQALSKQLIKSHEFYSEYIWP